MDIKLKEILIKELFDGYEDNDEEGVFGYGGKIEKWSLLPYLKWQLE